jgi:hypothetical protein
MQNHFGVTFGGDRHVTGATPLRLSKNPLAFLNPPYNYLKLRRLLLYFLRYLDTFLAGGVVLVMQMQIGIPQILSLRCLSPSTIQLSYKGTTRPRTRTDSTVPYLLFHIS